MEPTNITTRLLDVARSVERLAEAATVDLPRAFVHSNAPTDPAPYAARAARPDAIDLVRLAPAVLRGDDFRLSAGGIEIAEQFLSHTAQYHQLPVRDELPEGLLLARYGDGTWGHWIGELLPKAIMAERRHPGRFRYLVPERVAGEDSLFAQRVREALATYGITRDRLIPLRADTEYRCAILWAVTPAWSDGILHPAALAMMRDLPIHRAPDQKLALVRYDERRSVANADEVNALLQSAGLRIVNIAALPFTEQVAAFRSGKLVFSVLGSSLSGLIYSPHGVKVIAATPQQFSDIFFYGMIQQRDGQYAEVRGTVPNDVAHFYRDNAFVVPLGALRSAIDALDDPWNDDDYGVPYLHMHGDVAGLPRRWREFYESA